MLVAECSTKSNQYFRHSIEQHGTVKGLRRNCYNNQLSRVYTSIFSVQVLPAAGYRSLSLPPPRDFGLDTNIPGPALANWVHATVTSAFSKNSLRRSCCCKPIAHCNRSRDSVDLLAKLRLRHKLRPALPRLVI